MSALAYQEANHIFKYEKHNQIIESRSAFSLSRTCHRTGDSAVATGGEGADGVWVLIMYCSGAAYLNRMNVIKNVKT